MELLAIGNARCFPQVLSSAPHYEIVRIVMGMCGVVYKCYLCDGVYANCLKVRTLDMFRDLQVYTDLGFNGIPSIFGLVMA